MSSSDCPPNFPFPDPHHDNFPDTEKKSDWTVITFMIAMALGCAMILSAVFIYYQCVRRPEQRLSAAERRHRRRRRGAENFSTSPAEGLGGAMVDSLPVFVYTPENHKEGLRCAVCLCEFQQSEKGRLLPGCNHSFHVDCIGMWFYSHSTCPLCRTKVEKQANASLELGHTQMELSGPTEEEEKEEEEETGENEVVGSTSVSPAAEQHGNGGFSRQKDDDYSEEGKGEHVSIDLGQQRKPASCSITSTG